ncbi:MAG: type II toxin-antitoxin system HicB family antitoxin [Trueperaceae bacterium]|nr:type II toxin-antitoxin system HicB family antitoxin [Trueperaceae bacterium]
MKNMLEYKGYMGSVQYSAEDRVFYGKIEHIRGLVTFEGGDVDTLETAFRESVDDYLDTCRELGREPEKPFKGTFNVRTGPALHRRAAIYASTRGKSLNQVVTEALDTYLERADDQGSGASMQ